MKTAMPEMKNTQYEIKDRLAVAKEKISKTEDITFWNESHRGKK